MGQNVKKKFTPHKLCCLTVDNELFMAR